MVQYDSLCVAYYRDQPPKASCYTPSCYHDADCVSVKSLPEKAKVSHQNPSHETYHRGRTNARRCTSHRDSNDSTIAGLCWTFHDTRSTALQNVRCPHGSGNGTHKYPTLRSHNPVLF